MNLVLKKIIVTLLTCFILVLSFGQKQRKISTYLSAHFNLTIYDVTVSNNPCGVGLGVQSFLNTATTFKPTIEITADTYFAGSKNVILMYADDVVESMVNLFAGASFHPTQSTFFSFLLGPSFINGETKLGIKPSFGFYFSKSKGWEGKLSFINVFNRVRSEDMDFGSFSLSAARKLF